MRRAVLVVGGLGKSEPLQAPILPSGDDVGEPLLASPECREVVSGMNSGRPVVSGQGEGVNFRSESVGLKVCHGGCFPCFSCYLSDSPRPRGPLPRELGRYQLSGCQFARRARPNPFGDGASVIVEA